MLHQRVLGEIEEKENREISRNRQTPLKKNQHEMQKGKGIACGR